MNFQALKWMIDNLVQNFTCPECMSKVSEEFIEIVWTAGTSINIDVECPKCEKHSMIKAQVYAMNIPIEMGIWEKELENIESKEMAIMQEKLSSIEHLDEKIKNISEKIDSWENTKKDNNSIKDTEIISLNKNLKSANFSIESLFNEDNK